MNKATIDDIIRYIDRRMHSTYLPTINDVNIIFENIRKELEKL